MRHQKQNVGLNRTMEHRRALLANLASSLFTNKKIVTTLAKARVTRSYAERLITFARRGKEGPAGLAAVRHVATKLYDKSVIKELFDNIGPKFRDRNGGYTRIIKLDNRRGDNAPMAILELVGFTADDITTTKAPAKKSAPRKKAGPAKAPRTTKTAKPTTAEAFPIKGATGPAGKAPAKVAELSEEGVAEVKAEETEEVKEAAPKKAAKPRVPRTAKAEVPVEEAPKEAAAEATPAVESGETAPEAPAAEGEEEKKD